MSTTDVTIGIFKFAPTNLKTVIISVILVLFFLGTVSIILTPEDEYEKYEHKKTDQVQQNSPSKKIEETEVKPVSATKSEKPKSASTTPVKTNSELLMSPGRRSERKKRQTIFFQAGSPR
jgi:hypothetical protein